MNKQELEETINQAIETWDGIVSPEAITSTIYDLNELQRQLNSGENPMGTFNNTLLFMTKHYETFAKVFGEENNPNWSKIYEMFKSLENK